jgi:hypothetical protein
MSSIPDGSYHLYTTDKTTRPIVVELMCDYVAICGEEGWRPLSSCPGRLVRLREVEEVLPDEKFERES